MIPKPVPVQRPLPLNPIENAASYANRILAGINSGSDIAPSPNTQSLRMGQQSRLPQKTVSGRQGMIQESASRQHNSALQGFHRAAEARKQKELSLATQRSSGGVSGQPGGNTGAGTGGVYGLTPRAGAALQQLQAAYRQRWGSDLPVNSGGRTRAEQQHLYDLYKSGQGNLAAPPGTSVHESGRAVDFGGAAHNYSPQHTWLVQNAPSFGWLWAGQNFSQVEPWHFEYSG